MATTNLTEKLRELKERLGKSGMTAAANSATASFLGKSLKERLGNLKSGSVNKTNSLRENAEKFRNERKSNSSREAGDSDEARIRGERTRQEAARNSLIKSSMAGAGAAVAQAGRAAREKLRGASGLAKSVVKKD